MTATACNTAPGINSEIPNPLTHKGSGYSGQLPQGELATIYLAQPGVRGGFFAVEVAGRPGVDPHPWYLLAHYETHAWAERWAEKARAAYRRRVRVVACESGCTHHVDGECG